MFGIIAVNIRDVGPHQLELEYNWIIDNLLF